MGLLNIQSPLPGLHLRRQAPPVPATKGYVTVRRSGALGDSLAATVVVKKLRNLGFEVIYQTRAACHPILRRVPVVNHLAEPNGQVMIDLDGAYEQHPDKRRLHFAEMFVESANRQLNGMATIADARNCAPRMVLTDEDRDKALKVFSQYPKPWVLICPKSGSWPHRTVLDSVWLNMATAINGTCLWLGPHPAPPSLHIIDLHCRTLDDMIAYCGMADLLVSTDTGPVHVAAALGTPCVVVQQSSFTSQHISNQRDWIGVASDLTCLNCRTHDCPIDIHHPPCQDIPVARLAKALNDRLFCIQDHGISAVVVIHRPPSERLNRCLNCLLPQVDEIVVVYDRAGEVPQGTLKHDNIRCVFLDQDNTGYSRKLNFGVRHTNHRWLAFVTDDVFLYADAVQRMCEVAGAEVGMVGMQLRYEDGSLQHAGKHRPHGANGWGHLDLRQHVGSIKQPVEMENVCGAAVLVRREAFYQASGYDDDIFLYSEDDIFALRLRQAGWRVVYTPHATGVHIEHASTGVLDLHDQCRKSDLIMRAKWGWWFNLNHGKTGLGVFE